MLNKQLAGFRQTLREFLSSKSNWTGLTAIITAGVGYATGAYTEMAALQQIMGGLAVLFVRDAIAGLNK